MELNVINDQGKPTAKLAASDAAFGREYNEALVHQVVTAYLANARLATRAQKDRGTVTHTTKKPWRQKGTGRARAGMTQPAVAWRRPDFPELAGRELLAQAEPQDVPRRPDVDPLATGS